MLRNIIDKDHPIYSIRKIYTGVRELSEKAIEHTKCNGYNIIDHEIAFSNLAFELMDADIKISREKHSKSRNLDSSDKASFERMADGYIYNIKKWNSEAIVYLSFYSKTIESDKFLSFLRH